MNELDFQDTETRSNRAPKGPPKPLTPAMLMIAAKGQQFWNDFQTKASAKKETAKAEKLGEIKEKQARWKQSGYNGRGGFKTKRITNEERPSEEQTTQA